VSDRNLRALLEAGREAWPEIEVSEAELEALVAEKSEGASADKLDGAELWLACACGRGDEAALAAFERRYFPEVHGALRSMGLGRDVADDIAQKVREKLLVAPPGERIRLLDYAGEGQLGGLLRVVAVRIALNTIRRDRRQIAAPDDVTEALLADLENPELELIKRRHRAEFKRAFEEAIAELSAHERTLLRLHVLDQLSIDEIGTLYNVHRATAARRLVRVRETLEKQTRRRLKAHLGISSEEFDSIVRLIQSQLELSFSRILSDGE
jgi:RNA polymerase sigma-70 factor (ECF subfamily)